MIDVRSTSDATTVDRRPVGLQLWRDLLFLHQPVPVERLRSLVPATLTIDTFDGQAWATLIPFAIYGSRPAGAPGALSLDFLEVNLRTYVLGPDGEPGIYFFSLEASSWLAVAGARLGYALPYFPATMDRRKEAGGATIHYRSFRQMAGRGAGLEVTWQVGAPTGTATPGSLAHFLVERYVLFAARRSHLVRARVSHQPYPLCRASVEPVRESLFAAAGLPALPPKPLLIHHSPGVDVQIYWRRRV
jgi:uncharacterized protein YqjF (DUF2071 family)